MDLQNDFTRSLRMIQVRQGR